MADSLETKCGQAATNANVTGDRVNALERQAGLIWMSRRGDEAQLRPLESDRAFGKLFDMLRPRIHRLIRQYGLIDMTDDAQQAAAIAVHRALDSFDPDQAKFSTHVTWQIRGELQSLRHRVRLDQRRSARSAGARTVSFETLSNPETGTPFEIVDDAAYAHTQRGASDNMVHAMMAELLDRLGAPEHERDIMYDTLFDRPPEAEAQPKLTSEQRRQVVRRTWRNCIKLVAV